MRIVMMGTGTFAEPTFRKLIANGENIVGLITQPERDAGQKRGSTRQTGEGMTTIATNANIPIFQPESINTPDSMARLAEFEADLLVVAAYGQILKPAVISTPKLGAINVHASLLPKYRGASPIAHAILNGETTTGVTIIRITPGLDAGEMLAQKALPIPPQMTTGEMEVVLGALGAEMCADVVTKLHHGPVTGISQDASLVTKAPKFTKEMGAIDWQKRPAEIVAHIYAMQPWPTAYTFYHRAGKPSVRVIVSQARVAEGESQAGQVIVSGVELLELQPAGKKKMTAAEFARGYPLTDGCHFGPEVKS
ncbi:MAG: methionyl-tRNA formyltransferase [Fimbriiglobus sp.]